jgi:hypothetical protein
VKPRSATEKDAEVSKHIQHLGVPTTGLIKEKGSTVRPMVITNQALIPKKSKIDIEKLWGE